MVLDLEVGDLELSFSNEFGDRMEQKFKHEVNMILFAQDFYVWGFSLGTDSYELASCAEAVLPPEDT